MSSTFSGTDRASRAGLHATLAGELYAALRERFAVPPLSARGLGLDIDDAYRVSLKLLELRLADGERVIGKKIGATSRAVQDLLGVHQPDFGFLTSGMQVLDSGSVQIAGRLIQPRAEAEIAFILRRGLKGPGVTPADVLEATESIAACFEIVDSRIENWKIGIIDTVADNASCGVFVLGAAHVDPRPLDLARARGPRLQERPAALEGPGRGGAGLPARLGRLAREYAGRLRCVTRCRRGDPLRVAGAARARAARRQLPSRARLGR
jgi:2-oxopent-4-enoate/cis-2-oxohex-4-enoate hydratase